MNTTYHIALIKAHLNKLVALADKRTPGDWKNIDTGSANVLRFADQPNRERPEFDGVTYIHTSNRRADATFIASCAGNAERGWRSTLDHLDECCEQLNYAEANLYADNIRYWRERIEKILAEWPVETLTLK